jgi:general secretion pathway protein D
MSLRLLRFWLAAVICGAGSVFAQSASSPAMPDAMLPGARPTPPPAVVKAAEGEMLPSLQLADASIDAVLDLLQMLTGKTVIRPQSLPLVPGITLDRKKPIPKEEAILALETLLSLNQIGVAPMGDKFLKVVALGQVKMEAPTLISGSTLDLPASGRIAAKFFQLEFLQTTEVMAQLQGILTQGMANGIVMFDRANALFITDTISNLQRVELLLKQIDHPNAAMPRPKYYQLKFAKASDIMARIQGVLQSPKLGAQVGLNTSTTISADDRTNKVIIVADARLYPMFDDLIDQLDSKGDSNTHTEYLRLKAADCTDLTTLLNSLINGEATAAQKAGQQSQRGAQAAGMPTPTPATPNTPAGAQQAAAQQALAAAQNRLRSAAGANGGDVAAEFSPYITIVADKRTNSIMVNGTNDDLRLIRELVDKMDIILMQVRIEVVIADVTLDDTDTTGIDALGFQVAANKLVGISLSAPTLAISGATASSTTTGGTTNGSYASLTPGGRFFGYSLTGVLGLTTTPRKGKTQILSSPTITTSHNKKATFFAGEQRPQINGYLNTGTTSTTVGGGYQSNVGQQQIGITLTVTPLIGDDGSVQLSIQTDVEEPLQDVIIDGNAQAHTSKRTTDSYITAKSGEIIVLGGLQKTTEATSTSRLGPIPIIGDLLGTRSKAKHRTDLIFFLRPLVLTNTETDNDEFMKRLDGMPHKEEVKTMLDPNAPAAGKRQK